MTKMILIAFGGALGAMLRYAVSGLTYISSTKRFRGERLLSTFVVRFLSAFWALSERITFSPKLAPFLLIGVLGAFTTFSKFALEPSTS